jgi:hypothetical protein
MYVGLSNGVDFGMSVVVGRDCPIGCAIADGDPPVFTFGSPAGDFRLFWYFDIAALREFVTVAREALTMMSAPHSQTEPDNAAAAVAVGAPASDTEPGRADYEPWVWINQGCPMDYVVTSGDAMFFRLGAAANIFEPEFHIDALSRLEQLASQALSQLDSRECPADRDPACASTAS